MAARGSFLTIFVRRALPALIVFDLDACLWTPEMYELSSAPTAYDASLGGVRAGRDTVKLFPGAAAVLAASQGSRPELSYGC